MGRPQNSRAGHVLVADEPVLTEYLKPTERVLFCSIRDANPFFHLMESLWMLAGRRDGKWLDQFVKDFSSRFAEEDGLLHGAYGYRWRNQFTWDQLDAIVNRLRKNHNDRRVVLQMWDTEEDLYDPTEVNEDTGQPFTEPKDLPCNTQIYFRVVQNSLDMTVMCRSNDIVWGCYGANVVHMSMLQEYMAERIGVGVGIYRQFSNNWHAYIDTMPKDPPLIKEGLNYFNEYEQGGIKPSKFVHDRTKIDDEIKRFVEEPNKLYGYENHFLRLTAQPMFNAWKTWKAGDHDGALSVVGALVEAQDWKMAAKGWMLKRINR